MFNQVITMLFGSSESPKPIPMQRQETVRRRGRPVKQAKYSHATAADGGNVAGRSCDSSMTKDSSDSGKDKSDGDDFTEQSSASDSDDDSGDSDFVLSGSDNDDAKMNQHYRNVRHARDAKKPSIAQSVALPVAPAQQGRKRRRGRPPKKIHLQSQENSTNRTETPSPGRSNKRSRFSSDYSVASGASTRRSRRVKSVDVGKDLVILLPDDDPLEMPQLDIRGHSELFEFQSVLLEDTAGYCSDFSRLASRAHGDEEQRIVNDSVTNNQGSGDSLHMKDRIDDCSEIHKETQRHSEADAKYSTLATPAVTEIFPLQDYVLLADSKGAQKWKKSDCGVSATNSIKAVEEMKVDYDSYVNSIVVNNASQLSSESDHNALYKFFDYDADDMDREFLSRLSSSRKIDNGVKRGINTTNKLKKSDDCAAHLISLRCFEIMMSRLERELELRLIIARSVSDGRLDSDIVLDVNESLIAASVIRRACVQYIRTSCSSDHETSSQSILSAVGPDRQVKHKMKDIRLKNGIQSNITAAVRDANSVGNPTQSLETLIGEKNCTTVVRRSVSGDSCCDQSLKAINIEPILSLKSKLTTSQEKNVSNSDAIRLSRAELLHILPYEVAREVLLHTLRAYNTEVSREMQEHAINLTMNTTVPMKRKVAMKRKVGRPPKVQNVTDIAAAAITEEEDRQISLLYDHWVSRRCGRESSLLRCFHDFMMEHWQRDEEYDLPVYNDFSSDTLGSALQQLHEYRRLLDRARLITDRVRRRERLKRECYHISSEQLDELLTYKLSKELHIVEDERQCKVEGRSRASRGSGSTVTSKIAAEKKWKSYYSQGGDMNKRTMDKVPTHLFDSMHDDHANSVSVEGIEGRYLVGHRIDTDEGTSLKDNGEKGDTYSAEYFLKHNPCSSSISFSRFDSEDECCSCINSNAELLSEWSSDEETENRESSISNAGTAKDKKFVVAQSDEANSIAEFDWSTLKSVPLMRKSLKSMDSLGLSASSSISQSKSMRHDGGTETATKDLIQVVDPLTCDGKTRRAASTRSSGNCTVLEEKQPDFPEATCYTKNQSRGHRSKDSNMMNVHLDAREVEIEDDTCTDPSPVKTRSTKRKIPVEDNILMKPVLVSTNGIHRGTIEERNKARLDEPARRETAIAIKVKDGKIPITRGASITHATIDPFQNRPAEANGSSQVRSIYRKEELVSHKMHPLAHQQKSQQRQILLTASTRRAWNESQIPLRQTHGTTAARRVRSNPSATSRKKRKRTDSELSSAGDESGSESCSHTSSGESSSRDNSNRVSESSSEHDDCSETSSIVTPPYHNKSRYQRALVGGGRSGGYIVAARARDSIGRKIITKVHDRRVLSMALRKGAAPTAIKRRSVPDCSLQKLPPSRAPHSTGGAVFASTRSNVHALGTLKSRKSG